MRNPKGVRTQTGLDQGGYYSSLNKVIKPIKRQNTGLGNGMGSYEPAQTQTQVLDQGMYNNLNNAVTPIQRQNTGLGYQPARSQTQVINQGMYRNLDKAITSNGLSGFLGKANSTLGTTIMGFSPFVAIAVVVGVWYFFLRTPKEKAKPEIIGEYEETPEEETFVEEEIEPAVSSRYYF